MRASSKETKENSGLNQLYKIIAKEKEIEDANRKREEQLQVSQPFVCTVVYHTTASCFRSKSVYWKLKMQR